MDQPQEQEIQELLAWWQDREQRCVDEPEVPIDTIALMYAEDRRARGTPSTLHADTVVRVLQEFALEPHTRPARC